MHHKQADRTPIFEYVFSRSIPEALLGRKYYNFDFDTDEWMRYSKEVGLEKALRQYVVDRLELCDILHHDMLYVCPNPVLESHYKVYPYKQEFDTTEPEEFVRARNERRKWQQENNTFNEDEFLVYDIFNDEMSKMGRKLDLFAPGYAHGASTDANLLQTMLIDEDITHEHYKLCTSGVLPSIDAYHKRGVRHIGVGGDFSGNRPIISPQCYHKYIVPEVKKTTEYVHQKGAWAVNASDGDLWPVIDDFLITIGVDAYMEIDAKAGMNLKKLKTLFGDRITFYGNIDCGLVLSYHTEDDIRKETIQCLEDGMGNGGHIFTPSNAITDTIPVNNYLAMVNAYADFFSLPNVKVK